MAQAGLGCPPLHHQPAAAAISGGRRDASQDVQGRLGARTGQQLIGAQQHVVEGGGRLQRGDQGLLLRPQARAIASATQNPAVGDTGSSLRWHGTATAWVWLPWQLGWG